MPVQVPTALEPFVPFIILLIVAILVNAIPMDATFKRIINVILGVAAMILVLRFVHFL